MDLAVGPAPQNFQRDGAMSSELQSFHVFVLCLASWLADLQHRKHVMGHDQLTTSVLQCCCDHAVQQNMYATDYDNRTSV